VYNIKFCWIKKSQLQDIMSFIAEVSKWLVLSYIVDHNNAMIKYLIYMVTLIYKWSFIKITYVKLSEKFISGLNFSKSCHLKGQNWS